MLIHEVIMGSDNELIGIDQENFANGNNFPDIHKEFNEIKEYKSCEGK